MKISVRVPEEIALAMADRPERPSEIVRAALRAYLELEGPDLRDAVNDHEARLERLERMASL